MVKLKIQNNFHFLKCKSLKYTRKRVFEVAKRVLSQKNMELPPRIATFFNTYLTGRVPKLVAVTEVTIVVVHQNGVCGTPREVYHIFI